MVAVTTEQKSSRNLGAALPRSSIVAGRRYHRRKNSEKPAQFYGYELRWPAEPMRDTR